MAIYRGAGGAGDAVGDASSEATLVQELVNGATTQANNAATSATAAQAASTQAVISQGLAADSATAAATAETNAETAETNAETAQAAAEAAQTAAEAAQTAAELAETNAETAETNAETAASQAATFATNASNSASAASTSATNASNSATAAATSATNAAASYDAFDDRYLGSKSSNPTVDNDGNALLTGALYYNTVAPEMRVYNGSAWVFVGASGAAGVNSFNTRFGDVTLTSSDVTTALTYTPLAPAAIGTTVQAYDADLTTLGAGGTGARSFLGLAIGTDVQAWDTDLDTWATKTAPSGTVVGTSDSQTLTNKSISGSTNTLSNIGNASLTNSAITINGTSTSLGGSISVGTVTSVTGTSPVASSGGATPAISLSANYGDTQNPYASKTANFVLAAPNGSAGEPTFRAIVAADIPTLNQNTTGTASNVTGTVAIANGGTGQTTAANAFNALSPLTTVGDILYEETGAVAARLAIGTTGQVLTVTGGKPAWETSSATPSGVVLWFAANAAPTGYLKANGATVSRTTYASLFSAIGTTFGVGDGSTTFGLPDLRGEFIRGWDDGKGTDSGRAFGSSQTDLLRNHTHNYNAPSVSASMTSGASNNVLTSTVTATGNPNASLGGAETRPRNIALLACIKF